MSGELISCITPGGLIFCSIIFSSPLPIEQTKKSCGITPINVAQKKFKALTLNIHGNTQLIAQGIPPQNL